MRTVSIFPGDASTSTFQVNVGFMFFVKWKWKNRFSYIPLFGQREFGGKSLNEIPFLKKA